MDFPVAPAIREALQAVIDGDEFGYPDWGGVEVLVAGRPRCSRSAWSDRYGWEPALDRVHDLANVIQGVRAVDPPPVAIRATASCCTCPPTTRSSTRSSRMDRRLVPVEWDGDGFDYERLDAELAAAAHACGSWPIPHNPTRARVRPRRAGARRRHRRAPRPHGDRRRGPCRPDATRRPGTCRSRRLGREVEARTVTLTSASKAFNLAGMRWAVMHSGSDAFRDAIDVAARPLPRGAQPDGRGRHGGGVDRRATTGSTPFAMVLDENRHALSDLLAGSFPGQPLPATRGDLPGLDRPARRGLRRRPGGGVP